MHCHRNSHTAWVNNQGLLTAITGLLDVGIVYLCDIRSDGFTLFFARFPGEKAKGGEQIFGILSRMILFSVSDYDGVG